MIEDFKLRIFIEVAAEGSFTKAAHKLGVSQPAISQNIADLEKNLSVKLFERMRGEVALTDAGKTFLEYANQILYWYKAADDMFGTVGSSSFSKTLSISVDSIVGDYILPSVLGSIISANNKSRFVVTSNSEESDIKIYAKLRTDAIDFESSNNIIGILPASLFASTGTFNSIDSGKSAIEDAHLVCLSTYKEALPLDFKSRVVCYSDSPALIVNMVSNSDSLVGILPQIAIDRSACDNLQKFHYPLPYLQSDIHISASSQSVGESLTFNQLKKILADSLI